MGGLGGFYAAMIFIGVGILAAVCLAAGLVLWFAARAVRRAGPDEPAPARMASLVLVIVVAAVAASPAVSAVAAALVGPQAVMSGTEVVAVIALGLGVLSVSAARLLRHSAARKATGVPLVVVILVVGVIQVWMTVTIVNAALRYRTSLEPTPFENRYADLIDGPSIEDLVQAVGSVGSWRPVSGSVSPAMRYGEWPGYQGLVIYLSGHPASIAVFAQCWVAGDPGELLIEVTDFAGGLKRTERIGRCDGSMQVLVIGPVKLPDWSADRLAAARAGDRDLLGVTARPVKVGGDENPGENAGRWVAYVSADPATPIDDLTKAVTKAAGTFNIR